MKEKVEKFKVTADQIKGLLVQRYGDAYKYAIAAEVSPRTGAWERRVDFMVFHCWDSENFELEAFEIKISKSDLKRELMDPSKHNCLFDEIDKYWIVAPDYVLDDLSIIPVNWGALKVYQEKDGTLALKTAQRPNALHHEQLSLKKLGRPFVASFCRAVNNQSATKVKLLNAQKDLETNIRRQVEQELACGAHIVQDWEYDRLKRCEANLNALGLNPWITIGEADKRMHREARILINRMESAKSRIESAMHELKHLKNQLDDLAKIPEEQEEREPIKINEEHEENQSEGRPAT